MSDAGRAHTDPDAHGGPSFDELAAESTGPGEGAVAGAAGVGAGTGAAGTGGGSGVAGGSSDGARHEAPAGPAQQTDAGGRDPVDSTGAAPGPAGDVLGLIRSRPAVAVAAVIALVAAVVLTIRRLRR